MGDQDLYGQGGWTPSNGPDDYDIDVSSSKGLQQLGASGVVGGGGYPYLSGKIHQIGSDAQQHAGATLVERPYNAQIPPTSSTGQVSPTASRTSSQYPSGVTSSSAPRDSRNRGRQGDQQPDTSSMGQDYLGAAGWSPEPSTNPGRRPSRSGSHLDQQRTGYPTSPTQPTPYGGGRAHRSSSSSQHQYDPNTPAPPLEDTRMSVDNTATGSSQQQRCIIPGCMYPAYFNVAEQEQMEYCGHGHEIKAIETGFKQRCTMCKGRPRRTGERVCGSVCRERAREADRVHGTYYGVTVTRLEPPTRPR